MALFETSIGLKEAAVFAVTATVTAVVTKKLLDATVQKVDDWQHGRLTLDNIEELIDKKLNKVPIIISTK